MSRSMLFGVCIIFSSSQFSLYVKCDYSNTWMDAMIPLHYKRHQAPTNNKISEMDSEREPILVVSYVTPRFITEISMRNMDFEVDIDILVEWYDNRLRLPTEDILDDSDNTLPPDIAEKIWYPSIYLDNCKGNGFLVSTPKDGLSGIINIGKLWTEANIVNKIGMRVMYRKTFSFTCDLDFTAYPFDIQKCAIQLSWNFKRSKPVKVKFYTHDRERPHNKNPIPVPPGFRLTSFVVSVHENDTSGSDLVTERRSLSFTFRRIFAQHLMLIFFPSMLIVVLSWLSFWLGVENHSPRVALGLTSLLTLATQFNAAQRDLPPVAKIKALDIWMFTSIFMVFASLIEYGIVQFFTSMSVSVDHQQPGQQDKYINTNVVMTRHLLNKIKANGKRTSFSRRFFNSLWFALHPRSMTSKVDYFSRIFFPLTFFLFNIWFWCNFYRAD